MRKRWIAVLMPLMLIGGCTVGSQREEAGMVIGGTLGGLLGSQVGQGRGQTAAVIAGTLAGAAVGGSVGRSMDETDRLKAARSLETVRTGVPSAWRNPDSGVEYEFTPTRTIETGTGPCREFEVEARIGGRPQNTYGTACRQADGTWRIVS